MSRLPDYRMCRCPLVTYQDHKYLPRVGLYALGSYAYFLENYLHTSSYPEPVPG